MILVLNYQKYHHFHKGSNGLVTLTPQPACQQTWMISSKDHMKYDCQEYHHFHKGSHFEGVFKMALSLGFDPPLPAFNYERSPEINLQSEIARQAFPNQDHLRRQFSVSGSDMMTIDHWSMTRMKWKLSSAFLQFTPMMWSIFPHPAPNDHQLSPTYLKRKFEGVGN